MAPKTIKTALSETLEDLSSTNFQKFCSQLLDRREEPRVRRNRVEGKCFLEITDVLVSTFTEAGALDVALQILRQIGCSEDADRLAKEAGGQSENTGSGGRPSGGPTGKTTMAESGCSGKHFVDKHRLELTQRVSNIAPILDELLVNDVIQQEAYDRIRSLHTSQEQMRELYSGPLKASMDCKHAFYKILETMEPYLIRDLKKNN